jgi:cob(I)alamin adenosyltransferase
MPGIEELGKVHVITGPGKGKTTAAFGLAMRAAGHGLRVCVIQFMKSGDTTGELLASWRLGGIDVWQFGTGRFVDPKNITEEDREMAKRAIERAKEDVAQGGCAMMILDEINVACAYRLIDPKDVIEMLRARRSGVEIVLTGRDAPREFIEFADYVSVIENKKHPHEMGLRARKGVEY